jgi:hypothetical protein
LIHFCKCAYILDFLRCWLSPEIKCLLKNTKLSRIVSGKYFSILHSTDHEHEPRTVFKMLYLLSEDIDTCMIFKVYVYLK